MPGAFGIFGIAAWSLKKFPGLIGGAFKTVRSAAKAARWAVESPSMWGRAAARPADTISGFIGRRAMGPGIILGGLGAVALGASAIHGGTIGTEGAARGYTPGITVPYQYGPMNFSLSNMNSMNTGATGSLAFALHNSRKA